MIGLRILSRALILTIFVLALLVFPSYPVFAEPSVEQGRYIVNIGGCNDCHTEGFDRTAGNVPEKEWLLGSSVGILGPWGTTYASNLRISVNDMSEDEWVGYLRNLESRPNMPWYLLRIYKEDDLRSIYRFIKTLPPDDKKVPETLPPGVTPKTPYMQVVMPTAK